MEDDINIPSVIYLHTPSGLKTRFKDRVSMKDEKWQDNSVVFWPENNQFQINIKLQQQGVNIREGELYVRDMKEPAIRVQEIRDMIDKHKSSDNKLFLELTKRICSTCHMIMYWKKTHTSMPLHQSCMESHKTIHQLSTTELQGSITLVLTYDENSAVQVEQVDNRLIIKDNIGMAQRHPIKIKNNTGKTISVKRVVVNNSQVSDSLFVDTNGKLTGHMITYSLNEIIPSGKSSLDSIELFVKNKTNSANHTVTIVIEEGEIQYKVVKELTIYKLYGNRCYDSNTQPRLYEEWQTEGSYATEENPLNDESYICKNEMATSWACQKIINEINIGLERVEQKKTTELRASPEALNLYAQLKIPLDRNNFLFNCQMFVLAEMYHHMHNQISMKATVLRVQYDPTGDKIIFNASLKDANKMNIQVGDLILIKPNPELCPEVVLIGQFDCKEVNCIHVKLNVINSVMENQQVEISTKIRTQPYLVLLHSLQIMASNQIVHNRVMDYLLPQDITTPKEYPKIDCPNKKLNQEQLTAFQKINNHAPGNPGFCLRGAAGTGKTDVLIENVCKDVSDNKTVAIICPTNAGMNDVYQRVVKRFTGRDIKIVKLGSRNTPVTKFCDIHCTEELTHDHRGHKAPRAQKIIGSNIVITTLNNCIRLNCILYEGRLWHKQVHVMYIDEAGYPMLMTLIIPLVSQIRFGNNEFKLVLIGDENQIQITPRSLLSRTCNIQTGDVLSRLIKTPQYMSNPQISHFLKDNYRNPKLITMEMNLLCYKDLQCHSEIEGKIVFHHIDTSYENVRDRSRYSIPECLLSVELAKQHQDEKVACISYYSSNRSVTLIEAYAQDFYSPSFSTAETVQGQECDHAVVALCCFKNNNSWHNDKTRLNVCLSRGKKTVTFVTNLFYLSRTDLFKPLMRRAMMRGQIVADERTLAILRVNLRINEAVEN